LPESRLPADQRRRLAFSIGWSLLLHVLVWNLAVPIGIPGSGSIAPSASPAITVTLATALASEPAAEAATAVQPAPEPVPIPPNPPIPPRPAPAADAKNPLQAEPVTKAMPPTPGLAGVISGPWYYAARYLHRRPTPLRPIRPAYPPLASDIAGNVVLLLFINERGTVDTHRILKAEPAGIFENAVVPVFIAERYAPGLIAGQAVKSQLLVEVSFEPGAEARVSVLTEPPRQ
jgi:outer membrane biosynthesis protein TonB